VGVKSSGKSSVSGDLANRYNVPVLAFDLEILKGVVEKGSAECPHLTRARAVLKELSDFDEDQEEKKAAKAERERRLQEKEENPDQDDEDDDEDEAEDPLADWEPEEEEAKTERVKKQTSALLAAVSKSEPYATQGYMLDGLPLSESHGDVLDLLINEGMLPECIVLLSVTDQCYVRRRFRGELSAAKAKHAEAMKELKLKRVIKKQKERRKELGQWRRRNIGDGDEGGDDEDEEDLDEDPEVPTEDGIRDQLQTEFGEESERAEGMLEKAKEEKFVNTEKISAEGPVSVVVSLLEARMARHLASRHSLLATPFAEAPERAAQLVKDGCAMYSSFALWDPVALADEREGRQEGYVLKKDRLVFAPDAPGDDGAAEFVEPPSPVAPREEGEEEEEAAGEAEAEAEEEELGEEELQERKDQEEKRQLKLRQQTAPRVAIFNEFVYQFKTDSNLLRFLEDPWRYLIQQPPPLQGISADPGQCFPAVPGPSGAKGVRTRMLYETPVAVIVMSPTPQEEVGVRRRGLGEHLALNLGAVHVSKKKLVQDALRDSTALSEQVQDCVNSCKPIPSKVMAKLIAARLLRHDVQQRGVILDCVPDSPETARDVDEALQSSLASTAGPIGVVHKVIVQTAQDGKIETWQREVSSYFDLAYRNVETISSPPGTPLFPTSFSVLAAAVTAVRKNTTRRQELVRKRLAGCPARIFDTSQLDSSLLQRKGAFERYCPAEWVDNRVLLSTDKDQVHRFAAEFCSKVYHFSDEARLASFLSGAERFEDRSHQYALPRELPRRMTQRESDAVKDDTQEAPDCTTPGLTEWEYMGFCPVTLYHTRDDIGLCGEKVPIAVFGQGKYSVLYQGKRYKMADAECCERFMQKPWVYVDGARLPRKLPIPKHLLRLPHAVEMDRYMEHTLHEAAVHAMLAVAEARPKFPGLSAKMSAVKFMAVHMKANNPNNSVLATRKYRENFRDFKEACGLFDYFLRGDGQKEESAGAAERSEEFTKKAELWDSLGEEGGRHVDPQRYIQLNLDSDKPA